ncbi:MAG: hypothetical protein M0R33_22150 [Methylomonas sp.]|jgi:hypothetical protein|uniref:hypothetical protein n=1 Tax=Methylomonas sp. TaxID=418 RepID=UPI0025E3DD1A|nr:hypothetical protein [Methylomonas sp.]MCK9609146.1 hypothetical protein [Methylomonas sp.]
MKSIKKSLFSVLAIFILVAPDLAWEHASHLLHIVYEGFSFFLEEVLMHGIGFTKHHAQMLVFYFLLFLICGLIWFLWRRGPFLVETMKAYMLSWLFQVRDHVIEIWFAMSAIQKVKLLAANLVSLWLVVALLLM